MFDKLPIMVYNAFELKSSKTAPPPIIYAKKAPAEMQGLLASSTFRSDLNIGFIIMDVNTLLRARPYNPKIFLK
jgi:hypothetical protein